MLQREGDRKVGAIVVVAVRCRGVTICCSDESLDP